MSRAHLSCGYAPRLALCHRNDGLWCTCCLRLDNVSHLVENISGIVQYAFRDMSEGAPDQVLDVCLLMKSIRLKVN
jgi:hypothetical protein